jgi:XRE family transcriptional regulator, aerobic/anaerobic benzoate catabolism transcriptional regulator
MSLIMPVPREKRAPDRLAAVDGYLCRLGERVREERARRGMTRKILARDSGLSERYLAQLESGTGNISIKLLRRVGDALNLPLVRLVGVEPAEPAELRAIFELLRRLPAEQLGEARALLDAHFTTPDREARHRRIALIGLRGAGKSTLGRWLSEYLHVPFIELDAEIERDFGLSLAEIFALSGQAAYRRSERRALDAVIERNPHFVLAAGGSIVAELETYEELLARCFTVWIKASPEEHMNRVIAQGDFRPMADNKEAMADLERILYARTPLYARADAVVDTAGDTVEASFSELLAVMPDRAAAPRIPTETTRSAVRPSVKRDVGSQ